jgi:uncharacterized protein YacL
MTQQDASASPRGNGVIFVEGVRLIVVLLGALVGYEIGHHLNPLDTSGVTGLLIGAAVSYVVGGVIGRTLDRGLQRGMRLFRNSPPGEIFAAAIISTSGMILGLMLGMALVALVRSAYAYVITAGIVWVFAAFGWRLGMIKGRQIVAAAGLSRILNPPSRPLPGQALLVDASAVMDRFLLILGRNGLLPGGLVVPQFVVDHVQVMAGSPDPVTARRARRGLEALEALLNLSVSVDLAKDEVPEVDDPTTKLLTLARRTGLRIGTCSNGVMEVVNLHAVTSELAPDHVPGERIEVSLVKEGRQPRQAVGYLADGDMVVVNDATHLIDEGPVALTVLSTRPTTQGLMVFAKLAPPTDMDEASSLTFG